MSYKSTLGRICPMYELATDNGTKITRIMIDTADAAVTTLPHSQSYEN
jgi:hypothetical protein